MPAPDRALSTLGTAEAGQFPFYVLLAVPDARTILIFALSVEAQRGAIDVQVITDGKALSGLIGGNLSRAVERRYGPHRLINVRRRVGARTAIYSSWLAFPDLAKAESFVRENPRFGLDTIEAKTKSQHETRKRDLQSGAAKGRYDLSRLDQNARLKRARFYVAEADELDRLECALSGLVLLRKSLGMIPDGISVG